MRINPVSLELRMLIKELNKTKSSFWKSVANHLNKTSQNKVEVNVSRINRNSKDGDIVIVPGKVLGSGFIDHKVIVFAWQFSDSALKKIIDAKGKCDSIKNALSKKVNPREVKIIG